MIYIARRCYVTGGYFFLWLWDVRQFSVLFLSITKPGDAKSRVQSLFYGGRFPADRVAAEKLCFAVNFKHSRGSYGYLFSFLYVLRCGWCGGRCIEGPCGYLAGSFLFC